MIFIDTNIFLRLILNDKPEWSSACRKLFLKIKNGEVDGVTTDLVVAEVIFILQKQSHVQFTRSDIAKLLLPLLSLNHLTSTSQKHWEEIFSIYIQKNVDFIDAYNMVVMQAAGIQKAYSYDRDFDKAGVLKRLEP